MYYLTTFFKLLYEFAPTTQVVVWLVLLPLFFSLPADHPLHAANQAENFASEIPGY
jgi:hypothetical protein